LKKVIFLDFDGVLNTMYYQWFLQSSGKAYIDEYGSCFDPNAVEQLKRIIDKTGADIVVESTWKYLGLDAMNKLWQIRNLPGKIIDITPDIPTTPPCKGIEIKQWIIDNVSTNEKLRYIILDDEYVITESQLENFILINPYEGITDDVASRAISILNA
jgi:hypothetical protein